jgi:hypothetical protein
VGLIDRIIQLMELFKNMFGVQINQKCARRKTIWYQQVPVPPVVPPGTSTYLLLVWYYWYLAPAGMVPVPGTRRYLVWYCLVVYHHTRYHTIPYHTIPAAGTMILCSNHCVCPSSEMKVFIQANQILYHIIICCIRV